MYHAEGHTVEQSGKRKAACTWYLVSCSYPWQNVCHPVRCACRWWPQTGNPPALWWPSRQKRPSSQSEEGRTTHHIREKPSETFTGIIHYTYCICASVGVVWGRLSTQEGGRYKPTLMKNKICAYSDIMQSLCFSVWGVIPNLNKNKGTRRWGKINYASQMICNPFVIFATVCSAVSLPLRV